MNNLLIGIGSSGGGLITLFVLLLKAGIIKINSKGPDLAITMQKICDHIERNGDVQERIVDRLEAMNAKMDVVLDRTARGA